MQATTSPSEAGGGYTARRGHVPQLSISDPSHHVTEAIGHMYDDDYDPRRDSRRLSYISSPLSESITTIPLNNAGSETLSTQSSHANEVNHRQVNGQARPPLVGNKSFDRDSNPASPSNRSPSETATASFPLNDIDYESDPAAVAQELSNLAAIRRMSMDVAATGDPDLPTFGSNFVVPSLPPSPTADENDAARLFWVPARLHPELAPKEFKSFLESKTEQIKRKSGDFSSLGPERQGTSGSLRRKRSMLSRQIDNSNGYTDGAERLETKRSESKKDLLSPNLHDLETLVDDSKQLNKDAESLLQGIQKLGISADEDKPILPPAPPGHSLRRSTRTQYRKGSLKKGEKVPYSKRIAKPSDANEARPPLPSVSDDPPILGLTRVSTDPTPSTNGAYASAKSLRSTAYPPGTTSSSTFDSMLDHKESANNHSEPEQTDSGSRAGGSQTRQWHSRISSNGRSTLSIPPSEQKIPEIIETPPPDVNRSPASPQNFAFEREPVHDLSATQSHQGSPLHEQSSKRAYHIRQPVKDSSSTLDDFANSPERLPGNTTRTDSLSFIPTLTEDKKPEGKKSKDKKDGDGTRKSSWHWLLGTEEKEKDKEKEKEKKKDKESDSRKLRSKLVEKVHDSTRLDVLQSSIDASQKGRESLVLDRLDPKLEEERRKDHVRRSSGESKKEKESGLFSSIFGGGRKKNTGESHHKKTLSRNLSPDPPVRELRPDVDYPWTRYSILEERAIYRMAHIKLANPRRALYSQVLLSNFMYSYLAKVQQMHPQMMIAPSSSSSQRQQKARDQPEEYLQYQRYQEAQEQQQYGDSYDESQMYDYDHDDRHDPYRPQSRSTKHGHENGSAYGPGHYQQYGHSSFGDDAQLDDDDDDDMW